MAFHHVAFATRDLEATHRFYEDLMGFPLVHSEFEEQPADGDRPRAWVKHVFYDTGDGECLAFFALENMGEQPDFSTDVSASVGLPVWVNHVAVRADDEMRAEVCNRMAAAGVAPVMELDHGWCHSHYYLDPNGILVELCTDTGGISPDPQEALAIMRAPVRGDDA